MPTSLATCRSDRATRLLSSHRSRVASRRARRVRSLRSPRDSATLTGGTTGRSPELPAEVLPAARGRREDRSMTTSVLVSSPAVDGRAPAPGAGRTRSRRGPADLDPVEVDPAHAAPEPGDVRGVAVDDHQVGPLP